ncbi:hypothetical protein MLD38_022346 [Melastoma candidum]|uniref:Uncharacterized protein n=1 Tax=Melastoma candidum TaxID=119954 RepID=A0ACB9QLZ6_9MYRT|nr:hypothetical protein MLD38_022346 [Melastoma candidum]
MSGFDISSATTVAADPPPPPPPEETASALTSAPTRPMEELSANPVPQAVDSSTGQITFSIWPPSQRTRDAVIARLIETLSTPSLLSKRYGTLPQEEAPEVARSIEEEAFNAAGGASPDSPDEQGLQILEIYSKEISKRVLDSMKARSATVELSTTDKAGAEENTVSDVQANA